MELREMLKEVFSTEGQERIDFAKKQLETLSEELGRIGVDGQNKGTMILEIIKLFVRADHHTSYEEYTFLRDLFGFHLSFHEFRHKIHTPHPDNFEETLETIVKSFSYEGRLAFCYFGLCMIESDEKMEPAERALIERVIKIDLTED